MIGLAFASLGFLVGNLIGLSAESTLSVVIPLVFAFGGGSAIAFLHNLKPEDRRQAGVAVTALAVACLIGVYCGIFVSEYQLFSPNLTQAPETASIESRKYLRNVDVRAVDLVDQRYKSNEITAEQAYETLYDLASSPASE